MYDLFSIAVVIIYTDERSSERNRLAVGYKERGIYDPFGRECQPCHEQCASKDAHCRSEDKLQKRLLHNHLYNLSIFHSKDVALQGRVSRLFLKRRFVLCDLLFG